MTDDEIRLIAGGWRRLRSGRWTHSALSTVNHRRRPFTLGQALTLQDIAEEEDRAPQLSEADS
jgi:hypothetical protein